PGSAPSFPRWSLPSPQTGPTQAIETVQQEPDRVASFGADHEHAEPGKSPAQVVKGAVQPLRGGFVQRCLQIRFWGNSGILARACLTARGRHTGRPGAHDYHLMMPGQRDLHGTP